MKATDLLVVDYEVRPEAVVLQAKGEVDSSTAGDLTSQLDAALQQAGTQSSRLLIVDLQAVTYFGSAGLNAVLDCHRQGLQAGTSVRLGSGVVLLEAKEDLPPAPSASPLGMNLGQLTGSFRIAK